MSFFMRKKKLVVLTGAGISAESGLKTFRDSDGLWENFRIEDVATPRAWRRDPELVLRFYNQRRQGVREARPNTAHFALAELESDFDVHIITQNIDDLHERAGSTKVMHLHGEIFKMRSEKNPHLVYPVEGDIHLGDRAEDGAQLRPHIVWFEEPVPMIERAIPVVEAADIFLLIGTSLVVYPAAGLVDYLRPGVPRYVLDKKLPELRGIPNIIAVEKPATEGIGEIVRMLKNH